MQFLNITFLHFEKRTFRESILQFWNVISDSALDDIRTPLRRQLLNSLRYNPESLKLQIMNLDLVNRQFVIEILLNAI